jgi:putative ABC transport system permease protein
MLLEVRLAWRNVWRNPRRTGLTVAATVFAVVLVVFFVAMAAGIHEKMIEDMVRVHSGHVTLAGAGWMESQTLDHPLVIAPAVRRALDRTPGVLAWAPRVLGYGLISKQTEAHGVALLGVDPAREPEVTTLAERLRQGVFVSAERPHGVVLGETLARHLEARLGDEVLLYSQAYTLETAADLFRVVGIAKLPDPELDRGLVILSLADAQAFFAYGDRVSEVAVLDREGADAGRVAARLRAELAGSGTPIEIQTWRQRMPELVQFIFLDDAGMYMLLVILIVVVAFGILNTILMSVLERTRELGVLLALGLRPAAVFRLVYLESTFLACIGLVLGLGIGIPLVLWFQAHPVHLGREMAGAMEIFGIEPVMRWKLKPLNPIGSTITVLGVALLAALYPASKASRGRPVDALRSL